MKIVNAFIFGIALCRANAATLHVNSESSQQYPTINDAIKAASPGDKIVVYAGTYNEKVTVDKDSITLQGSSFPSTDPAQNTVVLLGANYSSDQDDASATLLVTGSNVKIYNFNVTNYATGGDQAAVALSNRGNKNGFYTLSVYGYQGVFYAHTGSLFVARSYIEGAVDVIYGRTGNAWFQGVKLGATRAKTLLTAQGRQAATDDGYFVFEKAKIVLGKGAASGTKGSVYLGRPWGDYARVVFQNSNLGNLITDAGWLIYTATQNTKNILFGEYSNTNGGSLGARVSWSKILGSYTDITAVLPGYKDWVDSAYIGASAP